MPNEIKLNENEKIVDGKLHFTESFKVKPKLNSNIISKEVLTEAKNDKKKMVLKPRIEAIHAGRTRNDNIYPAERLKGDYQLKSGVYSFIYPYPKPMIKNHDHSSEPTGRITNAQFVTDTASGKEAVIIIPEITDPEAIEKVLDGRYMTVSIGASTDAAICNICGQDVIAEGHCGHWRGETYDDVVCGWIVGNLYFDECSWVNVPADSDAKVLSTGEPTVMEAYAEVDDKYYELGEDGKKEINKKEAQVLGLVEGQKTKKEEGGKKHMSKKDETKVAEALEESKAKQEALQEELTAKEEELTTAKEELATTKESLEEKQQKLEEAESLVQEKEEAIQEKEATIEEKNSEIEKLQGKIQELEEESEANIEKASEAKAEFLELLANTVVTFKEALGKPLAEDKEEALQDHMKRSEESLKDSLSDLKKEYLIKQPYTQTIENPGIGAKVGESNQLIVDGFSEETKEKMKKMTGEEIYKNLFSGHIK